MTLHGTIKHLVLQLGVTLVVNLLGTIWYHPAVFGGTFTALTKRSKKPGTPAAKLISYIFSFLLVVLLDAALNAQPSTQQAFEIAASLVFFSLLANLPHHLYEEKPVKLFLVHWGYQTVYVASASILLVALRSPGVPLYKTSTSSLL